LVIDLDNTSLGGYIPYARFTKDYGLFLDELTAAGCKWAINTTWDVNGQWQLVMNSPVESRPLFFMGEMGFSLATWSEKGSLSIEKYNLKMREKLKKCRKNCMDEVLQKLVINFTPERLLFYGHLFEFSVKKKDSLKLAEFVEKEFGGLNNVRLDLKGNVLTCIPAFLSKGDILIEVQHLVNIGAEETVVAADEKVDLSMMKPDIARYLICPSNAEEEVKQQVKKYGGAIGSKPYSDGIIEAFWALDARGINRLGDFQ